MLPTVLLLIYNRPDLTRRTVNRLLELGVTELYVSADGPKNEADRILCEQARECLSAEGIQVITNLSGTHRGCRDGVIHGINWFFGQVEEGIILEDDCLPTEAFLHFASELLNRHRKDPSVYMVSGNCPLGRWGSGHSHHFARIGHVWGWATWRDRWQSFDPGLPGHTKFSADKGFNRLWGNIGLALQVRRNAEDALSGRIDTWDFLWTAHNAMKGRLAAIPCENLVENTGFGMDATHTHERPQWISKSVRSEPLSLTAAPLRPDREYEFDLYLSRRLNRSASPSSTDFHQRGKRVTVQLRVIQVNSTDCGGGAEMNVMRHHRALLAKGHDALLLVGVKKSDGDDVLQMGDDTMAQILALHPDIVHVHNLHGTPMTVAQLTELSDHVPVMWTLRDCWLTTGSTAHPFVTDPTGLSFLDCEEWAAKLEQRRQTLNGKRIRFTAPGQWMRDRLLETHGIPSHWVPNHLPKAYPASLPKPEAPYILFVANHADRNPYKDLPTLRKAWEKMNLSLGTDGVDLICIGGVATEETAHGRMYRMLERQPTEVVLAYMKAARAVVQASRQESVGMTILEAHSVGTPVIGTLVGGIPEVVCPEEAELLCPAGDADALAAGIIRALEMNDELRHAVVRFFGDGQEPDVTETYLGHYVDMMLGDAAGNF